MHNFIFLKLYPPPLLMNAYVIEDDDSKSVGDIVDTIISHYELQEGSSCL